MTVPNPQTAKARGVLVLEDGARFEGFLFGAPLKPPTADVAYGEAVFNTSLAGYQEILTDPSYKGQILCMTAAHIGNTGMNAEDEESDRVWAAGFVIRELAETPSNWRSRESLPAYLERHGIPGLYGVDTRALTRHLRVKGVVRGVILAAESASNEIVQEHLQQLPAFAGRDLIAEVTTQKPYVWPAQGSKRFQVAAIDYGIKRGLLQGLAERGCEVTVYPAETPAEKILATHPDGIFLSNGPGDPEANPALAQEVAKLTGRAPLFGVCMGHQVLALSQGARTFKLKFGHRGGNQPVLDERAGRVEISAHNHGYAVDEGSLPAQVKVTHRNLNDKTVEGLEIAASKTPGAAIAFSVQYHPEACPGPHDSAILFERFISEMQRFKAQAK